MKKYLSLLIILNLLFYIDVDAIECVPAKYGNLSQWCYTEPLQPNEEGMNQGSGVCSPANTYYNPTRIVVVDYQNPESNVTYNIANIDVEGDTLNLYGWAFNVGYTNNLGSNTTIKVALSETNSVKEIKELMFNIEYAQPNYYVHKKLKYYDLTFWNCLRTSVESFPSIDGKLNAGLCMTGATPYLQGGFKASINLQSVKDYMDANNLPDTTFKVFMYVNSPARKSAAANEEVWIPLAASNDSETVDSSVAQYNNNNSKINISGLSEKAEVLVLKGRLMGSNGMMCSSPAVANNLDPGDTYFTKGEKYEVISKTSAYRGPDIQAYYQTLYKVSTTPAQAQAGKYYVHPGSGWETYIPATWVRFEGQMQIMFGAGKSPVKPVEEKCKDDVSSAICFAGDIGTKAVFHENDKLSSCTLEKNNHSGFTIVERSETNSYCTVACKDDLDIELPTTKEAASGNYFTLDGYTPKITAKRTCVTSEINYDTFEADLKAAEADMAEKYNIWQDYKYILENLSGYKYGYYGNCCNSVPCTENESTGACEGGCSGGCYSGYSWEIYSITNTPNGIKRFDGATGSYGTTTATCCGLNYGRTLEEGLSSYKNIYGTLTNTANQSYNTARNKYNNLVAKYRKCSSWLMDTEFTFKPTVSFNYDDRDGKIFPTEYTFNYNRDVIMNGFNTSTTYWTEYAPNTNEQYTLGGDGSADLGPALDRIKFNLVSCTGTGCYPSVNTTLTNDDRNQDNIFYTSKYIKREEDVTYTYYLPKVYTIIPSGKVTTNRNSGITTIALEDNAVPVNINTHAGTYNYILKITDIEDDLRTRKKSNNPDDDFKKRFNSKALNSGEEYVCNYHVINDIYLPKKEEFNFFYRTVDLGDINPNSRQLGYNWSNAKASKVINRMKEASESYQVLTDSADRDKFSFTLTPTIMKQIRNYNSTKNNEADGGYSDWDLYCADYGSTYKQGGYHCYSNFLTCLASAGSVNENKVGISCRSIFGNTLSNYKNSSDYDETDLRNNREILINKQNSLDGR